MQNVLSYILQFFLEYHKSLRIPSLCSLIRCLPRQGLLLTSLPNDDEINDGAYHIHAENKV